MQTIVDKAKGELLKMIEDFGSDPYFLETHVPQAVKWAKFMLNRYPEVDEEIVLLGAWLHDLGHYPVPTEIDHAVRGEERAQEFLLKEGYPKDKIEKVIHCVRAHRCRDVMPKTLEAKIIAFSDSASHMTDTMYFAMSMNDKSKNETFKAYAKMERDMRDLSAFPEVQKEMEGLYNAWRKLLEEYDKLELA